MPEKNTSEGFEFSSVKLIGFIVRWWKPIVIVTFAAAVISAVASLFIPFLLTIYISLLHWRANRPFEQASFNGLANYVTVLTNDQFWLAVGRTFYFGGVAVALELGIGFVLAMLVSRTQRGKALYTTIFLGPMMIVPVVVGYNFSMIYVDSGPLNLCHQPVRTSSVGRPAARSSPMASFNPTKSRSCGSTSARVKRVGSTPCNTVISFCRMTMFIWAS